MNRLKSQVQFILGSFYLLINSLYLCRPSGGRVFTKTASEYLSFTYQEGLEKTWSTKSRNFTKFVWWGARTCSLGPQTTSLYNFSTLRAIVSFRQIHWQLTDSRAIMALDLILRRSLLPRWRIFTDRVADQSETWDLIRCGGEYCGRDEIHWAFGRHLIPSTKLTSSSHKTFHFSYMKVLDEMFIKVKVSSIFKEKNNSG